MSEPRSLVELRAIAEMHSGNGPVLAALENLREVIGYVDQLKRGPLAGAERCPSCGAAALKHCAGYRPYRPGCAWDRT